MKCHYVKAVSLWLTAFFVAISSCKDPAIDDNSFLRPEEELLLGTTDTLEVRSELIEEGRVRTNGVGGGIVGNINDPLVGSTTAAFYANFRTTTNNINFGDGAKLDSCVLALRYRGIYGTFSVPLNLVVYELNEDILGNVTYYAQSSFSVKIPPVGKKNSFTPNIKDSVKVYGRSFAPQLRIRLSEAFGNKILLADPANLQNSTAFLSFLKGLCVAVESGINGNGLASLDLFSPESGIYLYYQNNASDSLVYVFPITNFGQTVNRFEHSFSQIVKQALTNPQAANDPLLPVQSGGGTKIKLTIPYLDSLPKNIVINKAEIIVPLSEDYAQYDSLYKPPARISFLRITDDGSEANDTRFTDGNLETLLNNGKFRKRYRINITRFMQDLVLGNVKNNGFIVSMPDANGQRAVFENSSDKNSKIVFRITYTKIR
ncbi:MAG: DUF4270 family protein [Chitinophagales bacterium]|nr:DUF4270 family protein [Chitinophagales bacterium]